MQSVQYAQCITHSHRLGVSIVRSLQTLPLLLQSAASNEALWNVNEREFEERQTSMQTDTGFWCSVRDTCNDRIIYLKIRSILFHSPLHTPLRMQGEHSWMLLIDKVLISKSVPYFLPNVRAGAHIVIICERARMYGDDDGSISVRSGERKYFIISFVFRLIDLSKVCVCVCARRCLCLCTPATNKTSTSISYLIRYFAAYSTYEKAAAATTTKMPWCTVSLFVYFKCDNIFNHD